MAAQSTREQKIRDRFAEALADIARPTPLQEWLMNVRIPPADEGEKA